MEIAWSLLMKSWLFAHICSTDVEIPFFSLLHCFTEIFSSTISTDETSNWTWRLSVFVWLARRIFFFSQFYSWFGRNFGSVRLFLLDLINWPSIRRLDSKNSVEVVLQCSVHVPSTKAIRMTINHKYLCWANFFKIGHMQIGWAEDSYGNSAICFQT